MGNDLVVQMVLVGRNDLAAKLQRPAQRAFWSRIGARVRLEQNLQSVQLLADELMTTSFLDLLQQIASGITIYEPFPRNARGMQEF